MSFIEFKSPKRGRRPKDIKEHRPNAYGKPVAPCPAGGIEGLKMESTPMARGNMQIEVNREIWRCPCCAQAWEYGRFSNSEDHSAPPCPKCGENNANLLAVWYRPIRLIGRYWSNSCHWVV